MRGLVAFAILTTFALVSFSTESAAGPSPLSPASPASAASAGSSTGVGAWMRSTTAASCAASIIAMRRNIIACRAKQLFLRRGEKFNKNDVKITIVIVT